MDLGTHLKIFISQIRYLKYVFLKDKTKMIEIFLVNSRKTENRSQN